MAKKKKNNRDLYKLPLLTADKFTAENVLNARKGKHGSVSGACTPDEPWGGQVTGYLVDGTPVDPHSFTTSFLKSLTGDLEAIPDYIKEWNERIDHVCKSAMEREEYLRKTARGRQKIKEWKDLDAVYPGNRPNYL